MFRIRTAALSLAAVAALAAAGCGGSDDRAETLQRQGQLQESGRALQERAATIARRVQDGTADPDEIQRDAEQLTEEATDVAGEALESVEDDPNVPDEVQDQLDAAQQQLEDAN